MTPNQPSGTTPEPQTAQTLRARVQAWLASRTGIGLPPVSAPGPSVLAPTQPFMSREPVSDAQRPVTQAQNIRTREVMDRICATNNANVTRNYGRHTVDMSKRQQPPALTAEDLADAYTLLRVQTEDRAPSRPVVLDCVPPTPAQYRPCDLSPSPSPTSFSSYDSSSCSTSSYDSGSYDSGSSCLSSSSD